MRKLLLISGIFVATLVGGAMLIGPAYTQQAERPSQAVLVEQGEIDAEERSALLGFIEDQLSAPNRIIRLNGLRGSLSSNVALDSITVADEQGVWLTIDEPRLVWNRAALLLGQVEIEQLTADGIDFPRQPVPAKAALSAEAEPFALPDLPVSVRVENLNVGRAVFGEAVFGLAAEASLAGSVNFDGAELELKLDAQRLDGGGTLNIATLFTSAPAALDLTVVLDEPANGIAANLLNLEGTPPVRLAIEGQGLLSDLDVGVDFAANGRTVLSGGLMLDESSAGTSLKARLSGPLAQVLPREQRAFFGDDFRLEADAVLRNAGGVTLTRLLLDSGSLQGVGSAQTTADNFLSALNLDFRLVPTEGARIILPGAAPADQRTSLGGATANISYDAATQEGWRAVISASTIKAADLTIDNLRLLGEGLVRGVNQPQQREATYLVAGKVDGISAVDEAVQEAVGEALDFVAEGKWAANTPLVLSRLVFLGETFRLNAGGTLANATFTGSALLDAKNLKAFSALAGRDLGGQIRLLADGSIEPLSGIFDLKLDGTRSTNLTVGIEEADALFAGRTKISGTVARGVKGLTFTQVQLDNDQITARLNGRYASDRSTLNVSAQLADAQALTPQAKGAATFTVSLQGEQKPFTLNAALAMQNGRLTDRDVRDLRFAFDGTTDLENLTGTLSGKGVLGGDSVDIKGRLVASETTQALSDLVFNIGTTRLDGDLARSESGLFDAEFNINSRDIGAIASLALIEASGVVEGKVSLNAAKGQQDGQADLRASGVVFGEARLQSGSLKADFTDLFNQPIIDADVVANGLKAAGVDVTTLQATAKTQGPRTSFDLNARLATQNSRIVASGVAERAGARTTVTLRKADLKSQIANAILARPFTVTFGGGSSRIRDARLNIGGGSITVNGTAGEQLDLSIVATKLPLALANSVAPDLALSGTLSADVALNGSASAPVAKFSLNGQSIGATALRNNGLDSLNVSARGRFANNIVNLVSASASNGQGIELSASGKAPLSGRRLDLKVEGVAPLALANRFFITRGTRLNGTAQVNATVRGSVSAPQINGLASVSNAAIFDPLSNLQLENVGLIAGLNGDRADIQRFSARLAAGGTVNLSGSVGLSNGFPADLRVAMNEARYTDGQTFSTRASGNLSLTGPLASRPRVAGAVTLDRVEILVPETFGGADELLDVTHVAPPQDVARTLARFSRAQPPRTPKSRPVIVTLDVVVSAPSQIFVRGRGLDAELGGQVRLTGPINSIQPVGSFALKRGRLDLLGRRIVLDEGSITLTGNLNPRLNFVASTKSGDVTAFVRLAGRTSNLNVSFSSEPSLPDDEVLAQVVFGRSVGELSPFQIAQLAVAAAELTGGSGKGLVGGFRDATGLDELDVVADEEGNASVQAGKYLSDNVYLGVQTGAETNATINLDITDGLTARGAVGSEGESELGIFFEKDY